MPRFRRLPLLACTLAIALAAGGPASPPLDAAAAEALQRQIDRTLEAHRWRDGLDLIDRYLKDVRRDPIMLYNAACAHAQLGERDAAANSLLDAVKAGFRDFDTMESDPDLEPIRDHPTYTAILEARDLVRSGKAAPSAQPDPKASPNSSGPAITVAPCPQQDEWRRRHGDKDYTYESDPEHHLYFATSLDDEGRNAMRELLIRQADQQAAMLFEGTPTYPVLIAVPAIKDMKAYFADPTTTGVYEHAQRMLVTRDIGQSLQHEFTHLMHYGHMERVHQTHPIWIQEGIASLYEDYDIDAGGTITFRPNTRHNVARRAAMANASMPWSTLFHLKGEEFMQRSQSLYPQVRSIFEFLADRGKLVPFYQALVKNYREDRSGTLAMERVFGRPLSEVERSWKDWLRARGPIDDTISSGDGSLGIEIAEAPDGVRIKGTMPKSAARAAGMRLGDLIVGVDGRAVRSSRELGLILASKKVGETITVRFRRGEEYLETAVTLRPLAQRLKN